MANATSGFCGQSPFWDEERLVNNTFPEFTACFRMTVVTYVPCGWLWLVTPVHLRYVIKHKHMSPAPVSYLNTAKMVICLLLTVLTVGEMVLKIRDQNATMIPAAAYLQFSLQGVTWLLAAVLTMVSRKARIASPCVLFFFWTLSLMASVVPVYHEAMSEISPTPDLHFSLLCTQVGLLALQLFLSCWAETFPSGSFSEGQKTSPELAASFLNKLTFHWMNSLVFMSYKGSLQPGDMWDLPPANLGSAIVGKFQRVLWTCAAQRNKKARTQSKIQKEREAEKIVNGNHHEMETFLNGTKKTTNKTTRSPDAEESYVSSSSLPLLRTIFRTFYWEIMCAGIFKMASDVLAFCQPALLSALIHFMAERELYSAWHGYALVLAIFVTTLIASFSQHQGANHAHNLAIRLRTALVAAVYRKALWMNNETKRSFTTGAIVNFMSIDCQRLRDVMFNVVLNFCIPIQIILAFVFLYRLLGLSFLVGVGILAGLIPVNLRISLMEKRYQVVHLTHKDSRIRMISEILNGIKVTVGTLLTYTFVSEDLYLEPATAFVSLSLFNILRNPINSLPTIISQVVQCMVSIKRLRKFLSCEELDPKSVSSCTDEGVAISIRNGSFTWVQDEKPTLKDLFLEVREGQLVAVVGPVGAGKSSLLSAVLGEMSGLSGQVSRQGTVAYVSQQAWIQNGSFKDGILYGNSFNRKRYRKVIEACALQADLDSLPAGEETEIGEKGINLSGGQKLRVSLARAVYHDADLYLLDDPLSAVDSHVGQHIFRRVIGPTGMLRNKTRLMVTHGIHWLPMCDVIVIMDDGQIVWSGTYPDLTRDGLLTKFLTMTAAQDNGLKDPPLDNRCESVVSLCSEASRSSVDDLMMAVEEQGISRADTADRHCFPFLRRKKIEDETKEVGEKAKNSTKEGQQLVQDEEFEMGKIKGYVIKAVLRAFGWISFIVAMVILLLNNVFELAASFWLVEWTDDKYLQNTSLVNTTHYTEKTVMYVSVYAVLGIGQAITTFFFVWIVFLKMLSASKRLHEDMLRSVLHQPMSFFDTNPMGRILNRFSRDTDAIESYLADLMRIYCTNVFSVINILFVISYTTPTFLAAAVPLILLYYGIQTLYIPCSRQMRRYDSVSRSPVYVHFNETISGAPSIRAFGVTDRFLAKSEQLVDKNNVYTYAHISSLRWLKLRLELLGNLTTAFAALFTIMTHHLSASMAGLSVSYAVQVTTKLNNLVQNAINVETDIVSVERIVQYIELPSEPAWVVEGRRPEAGWPQEGDIRLQGYSTRYRPALPLVLNKVTAHICSGEKIGVVGRTGAGKSSLSLSLFRLIEAAEGSIIIDDINIADIGLHDLRSRLTILPQDPVLFSGTLRFNLDPLSKFLDEEMWSVLEQSHLKGFVESLPKRLEHEVDEGGLNLSVGQRQLVCLARALLRKTRVLVLDEATAAVDMETDELIQRTIRSAFKECTVLTIAHRLHTILDYDRILVLSNGTVLEYDSPDALLKDSNSAFFKLAQEANLTT